MQFFDLENEKDWCPKGEMINYIEGQKKVQEDDLDIGEEDIAVRTQVRN